MFGILLIFLISITPCLFYAWTFHKLEARTMERLNSARLVVNYREITAISSQPEQEYIEGVGYIIGDLTCKFNARSSYIRCAVNPIGPCKGCGHYQSIDID
ncbi:MAG: DUF6464 family protein [Trichodesmium sp. ALOHA_ZT_67]|nr:DUF6464 family protein [Trichodesmium sp. ALOHA_ZT_67]MDE5069717.1 DUF6464 family protein [Trichodesmium sp. St4_bin8_1]MDE5096606.1 DUF6464 family protein [Trichodesmium sp. St11_bin5]